MTFAAHRFDDANSIKLPATSLSLAPMLLAKRLHACAPRKLPANETLWCEGEERAHIFVIRTGSVCLSRTLPNGRRIVLDFAIPAISSGWAVMCIHAMPTRCN